MALSKTTQDHEEIRRWAEERGARPAEVARTQSDSEPSILRFCFPRAQGASSQNLQEISWDDFFGKFDENNLQLAYQEETASGRQSNFNKLVRPQESTRRTNSSNRTHRRVA